MGLFKQIGKLFFVLEKNRKKMKRKAVAILTIAILSIVSITGCGDKGKDSEVTVVKVADRQNIPEIWDAVNKILEPENIRVENKAYDSSVNLNDLLIAGDIDMNVAQHYAAIDFFKSSNDKYDVLTPLGEIGIGSLDLYSNKYKSVDELPEKANIGIPSDVMNGGRALTVLERAGLIKLNSDYVGFPDEKDIIDNPKEVTFTPIDTTAMVRSLDDLDAGFVYSSTAVYSGLNPVEDPIYQDEIDVENNEFQKQFVIVFTGVKGDENNEIYKKVIEAYHSDEVYKVYKDVLKGGSIPVADGKSIDLSKY